MATDDSRKDPKPPAGPGKPLKPQPAPTTPPRPAASPRKPAQPAPAAPRQPYVRPAAEGGTGASDAPPATRTPTPATRAPARPAGTAAPGAVPRASKAAAPRPAPAAGASAAAAAPAPPVPAAPAVPPSPGEAPAAGPEPPSRIVEAVRGLRRHPAVEAVSDLARDLGLWAVPHFLEDALRSLWRSRAWSAFAVGIIALSLATVGAFLLVAENLGGLVARMSSLEVSVYLREDPKPEDLERLRERILAQPGVEAARFVSSEQALAVFRQASPELASVPDALGENPFPASIEVALARDARRPEALERFAATVEALPGVDSVSRDLDLAERVLAASRIVKAVAVFLGGVLLLSALFTVSNVVKLTLYTRRDEVEILRLVGATSAYVRGTFVTEGVLQGLSGGALALLLLWAVSRAAGGYLRASELPLLASLATRFLSAGSTVLLVAAGAALGAVGSLLPLRTIGRA